MDLERGSISRRKKSCAPLMENFENVEESDSMFVDDPLVMIADNNTPHGEGVSNEHNNTDEDPRNTRMEHEQRVGFIPSSIASKRERRKLRKKDGEEDQKPPPPSTNEHDSRMVHHQQVGFIPSHLASERERRKLKKKNGGDEEDRRQLRPINENNTATPDTFIGNSQQQQQRMGDSDTTTRKGLRRHAKIKQQRSDPPNITIGQEDESEGTITTNSQALLSSQPPPPPPPPIRKKKKKGLQRLRAQQQSHSVASRVPTKAGLSRRSNNNNINNNPHRGETRRIPNLASTKGLRGRRPPPARPLLIAASPSVEENQEDEEVQDVEMLLSHQPSGSRSIIEEILAGEEEEFDDDDANGNISESLLAEDRLSSSDQERLGEEGQEQITMESGLVANHGLVEARAVHDDSQRHLLLPQAAEVADRDGGAKRRKENHKLLVGLLILLLGTVAVVVVVVVVVVITPQGSQTIEKPNSAGPTEEEDLSNITAVPTLSPSLSSFEIQELPDYTIREIAVTGTPQQKAYDWTFNHPEFDEMENWRKKQLLGLATFYYSLNGEAWEDRRNWMDHNTHECYWYTDRDSPGDCMLGHCLFPSKYNCDRSRCHRTSMCSGDNNKKARRSLFSRDRPPRYPNATNCDENGNFNFLKWATEIGVLEGTLPPELFFLTSLIVINLGYFQGADPWHPDDWRIFGTIPTEVGLLSSLEILDMSGNHLQGSIPSEIGMTNLTDRGGWVYDIYNGALALQRNSLTGSVPSELGLLSNLLQIHLQENSLTGAIPSQVGTLVELEWLEARSNSLSSAMPSEFGRLSKLRFLDLSNNLITSSIPSEIGLAQHFYQYQTYSGWNCDYCEELTGMSMVDLSGNLLTGTVPAPLLLSDQIHLHNNQLSVVSSEIRVLPSPSRFILDLGDNFLSSLPTELFLLTTLEVLRLAGNQLTHLPGEVAQMNRMGSAEDLDWSYGLDLDWPYGGCQLELDLSQNHLESIPQELGQMDDLINWQLGFNNIAGLPSLDWSNLSHVGQISLQANRFSTIPTELFQLPNLWILDLSSNLISDSMPSYEMACGNEYHSTCGMSLSSLNLWNNSLVGSIPKDLGNFTNLMALNLSSNLLTGSIPPPIFDMTSLQILDLSNNRLSAFTAKFSLNKTSLHSLILRNNSMASAVPSEIGLLDNLVVLDVSSNSLSGNIPSELGSIQGVRSYYEHGSWIEHTIDWTYLNTLNLSHNKLSGRIPTDLGTLTNLQVLDLSFNTLSGTIPSELGLLNATQVNESWKCKRNECLVPAFTQIVLLGNSFSGSLPTELCEWHCNGKQCHSNQECKATVLRVDCQPTSSLDCSVCAC